MSSSPGSKWMSDEPRSTASLITRCTSWMTEASSPEAPKLIGALSRRSYSGPAGAMGCGGADGSMSSAESSSIGAVAPLPKSGSSMRSTSASMSGGEATAGRTS